MGKYEYIDTHPMNPLTPTSTKISLGRFGHGDGEYKHRCRYIRSK